ncbi:MAG: hypothetical protein IH933_09640 [Euryarchaeota archaeon]|jgi:hypothetical protein|nr:hypothetical protein [Euryarchaeota archaeon]
METSTPTRRALLTAVLATGTAGCLFSDGSEESNLGLVSINNYDEEPHTVALRIEWDEERIHDQSYELEANDPDSDRVPGIVIEETWPETPGQFVVSARLLGNEWQTADPADLEYPECYSADANVDRYGESHYMTHSKDEHWCSDNVPSTNHSTNASGEITDT